MAFEASKREWGELYTFFRLLTEGKLTFGNVTVDLTDEAWPIAMIEREEHDGPRRYYIKDETIEIVGEEVKKEIPREDFDIVSQLIYKSLKGTSDKMVESPDGVEEFLDEAKIFDLEAKTDDRTDLKIAFFHEDAPLIGLSVRVRIAGMNPLLDGGRTANLKYEQVGIKFAAPMVNQVNSTGESQEVWERMGLIERLGGILKYSDVADKVFRSNLAMIDLHFARLLATMLKEMYIEDITKVSELTKLMNETNPLKIKEELIVKHHYYENKVKKFLVALALGMRPAKIYNGLDSAVEGIILVDGKGKLYLYHKSKQKEFENFLFFNTKFEKGPVEKDKYGYLEKENGKYYFRLNAKIGLLKR